MEGEQFKQWYFFPDQCRHCISPPCKMVADNYDDQAILHDPETGAIIFTERTKNLDGEEIKMACPYDIPRWDKDTLVQSKCDMCIDRVQNGLLPACVLSCPREPCSSAIPTRSWPSPPRSGGGPQIPAQRGPDRPQRRPGDLPLRGQSPPVLQVCRGLPGDPGVDPQGYAGQVHLTRQAAFRIKLPGKGWTLTRT